MTASNSEIRVLVAAIRKNGFKVAKTGNGAHQKVLRPNGSQVADADGPLIISGSPSDHRWRDMHVNRLMKAGVIKEDPWNPNKKAGANGDGDGEDHRSQKEKDEEAAKARRDRQLRDRSEMFKRRTQAVREAIEPIVSKMGGWSHGGSGVKVADFAGVMRWWVEKHEPKLIPTTTDGRPYATSSWVTQVTNLRTIGGTIAEKWLPIFERFVVALHEGNENLDPQESSLIYFDMLRESKGITATPAPDDDDDRPAPVQSKVVVDWPRVALEALFWMSRGADGQDRDTILDLAEEIAELAATNNEGT